MSTATKPREHPIIFSGPMVRAILERRKRMTRRVIKQFPPGGFVQQLADGTWEHSWDGGFDNALYRWRCPYRPGDRLWVKEKHVLLDRDGWIDPSQPRDALICVGKWMNRNGVGYADNEHDADSERCRKELGYRWRSPIHMPRWASRITLEVTGVRVEPVRDIGKDGRRAADVLAEGIEPADIERLREFFRPDDCPALAFAALWDQLNAKRGYGWDLNPWVCVTTFDILEAK